MAKPSGPRYFKPDEIVFLRHWAIDTEWSIDGSKDNVYIVKMTTRGFTCNCTGMTYHGKCKHTVAVARGFTIQDEDTST
jgi:hypothetical protein